MKYEEDIWFKDPANKGGITRAMNHRRSERTRIDPARIRAMEADWEYRLTQAQPKFKQLVHLIKKFGGVLPFSVAISVHPNFLLWNWLKVNKKGICREPSTGLVSVYYMLRVVKAARYFGILLTPEDLFPDFINDGVVKNPQLKPETRAWLQQLEPTIKSQDLEDMIASLLSIPD